jgi:hypothetical protein
MIKQTLLAVFISLTCGFPTSGFGQKVDTIRLENPSFEDYPSAAQTPDRWLNCGFSGESPPDTQPSGTFGVDKKAFDGETYLGLVVRDNNTWEGVGQKLKTQLIEDSTYSFSIYVCKSKRYQGKSQITGKDVNYVTPAIIRIWGGDGFCRKLNLLGESKPISSVNWEKIDFIFKPKINANYFFIEAFYKIPTLFPYNGNILIDNASAIVPILDRN